MKKSINEILEDLKNLNIPSSYEEIDYKNIENQRIKIKKYISEIKPLEQYDKCLYTQIIVFLNSFLFAALNESVYVQNILNEITNNASITHYNKLFYLFQLKRLAFLAPNLNIKGLNTLYKEIFNLFKKELNINYYKIPCEQRNKDVVFIITNQFLTQTHAPTKTTLDRAYTLKKHFNKTVLIINTADILSTVGEMPFFHLASGNVINEYSNIKLTKFRDTQIQIHQPKNPMPNIEEIKYIINSVISLKPYFILNIAGTNITSDICSMYVPTASTATVFSGVPQSLSTFKITANPKLADNDTIIQTTFTFDYKKQTHTYKRTDLNIPENKFIALIVGGRLDQEVKKDFLESLIPIFNKNVHIVFVGLFNNYNKIVNSNEILKKNTSFIGYQSDMLAVAELCDIIINPPRNGGGSSLAEGFSKGKPAVTLNFGDCSIAAGADFTVNTIEEMTERIIKYSSDSEYYNKMSQKAIERNIILTDTKKAMEEIINKMESSPYWW